MALIEDRGLFWWNDEPIPKDAYAPTSAIAGTLTISDNGDIRLDLDSRMPGKKGAPPPFIQDRDKHARNIQGILKGEHGYILLQDVSSNGGMSRSHGISYDIYTALYCLSSSSRFRADRGKEQLYRSVKVDLTGYEDWMWLRSINVMRRGSSLQAKYKREKDSHFKTAHGRLSIEHDLLGPSSGTSKTKRLSLTEQVRFRFTPTKRQRLKEAVESYDRIRELLILLTNSEFALPWPRLISADGKHECRVYFFRYESKDTEPTAHGSLINYPKVRSELGHLLSNLIDKRNEYGPGLYLYLGTRRGMKMFLEHRFVNLIWGLEAFDRRGRSQNAIDPKMRNKIDRILEAVSRRDDRHWLKDQLRHVGEPNLSLRLFEIFTKLPLPFNLLKLRSFCDQCADRRNEISHFGGRRRAGESYDSFLRDIDRKTAALASLYHLHLLREIGIDPERLDFRINKSWTISMMERYLRDVGVLDTGNS